MENFTVTLLLGAGVGGIIAWTLIAIYAFWRVGDARDEASKMADRSRLYEAVLLSDHRRPIWIWPDERIACDDATLALLRLKGAVQSLKHLVDGQNGSGIGPENLENIRSACTATRALSEPVILHMAGGGPDILIDLQRIAHPEEGWPHAILWVEEIDDETPGAGLRGLEQTVRALQKFIDALPFPVWQRDSDLNLVRVNNAYVHAVDATDAREVLHKGLELTQAVTAPAKNDAAAKTLKSGKTLRERQFAIIDNKRRALSITNVPMDGGKAIVGVAVDVTGEEEALSDLSRVLQAQTETLNHLRSPVAIFGPDQTLQFFNNAFQRFSGLDEDWLSREPSHDALLDALRSKHRVPEQPNFSAWRQEVLDQYTTLLAPKEEVWYLTDGTSHRVLTQPHPLGGLQVVLEDVTDHLALERSYNTLIAVQRETINSLFEAVVVFGSDGLLKLHNQSFQKLWNVADEQLQGKIHFNGLLEHGSLVLDGSPEWQQIKTQFERCFTERTPHSGRFPHPNGRVVDYTIVPLPDGAVMARMMDVSVAVHMQDAMVERTTALETADRLKSEFVTNMSYGLRVPLNSIIGFTEMLQQGMLGPVNDKQEAYLKNIQTASSEIRVMLSDVLDLVVMEAGAMTLSVDRLNVAELLKDAVEDVSARALKAGVDVTVSAGKDVGSIDGDKLRIQRVLGNLFINALRFSTNGAVIEVQATANEEDMICISLAVKNPKLVAEDWQFVQDAFDRDRPSAIGTGLGLDLALVRSFVELHHGKVALGDPKKGGLEIKCYLPRQQPKHVKGI